MTDTQRHFFTGNTLEQAVMSAARHFGVDPEDLAYERVERKSGFLRGRKRFVIRVDPERLTREREPAPPPAAAPGEAPVHGPEPSEIADEVFGEITSPETPPAPSASSVAPPAPPAAEEAPVEPGEVEEEAPDFGAEAPARAPRPQDAATPRPPGGEGVTPERLQAEGDVAEAAADCAVALARLADLDLEIEVLQGDEQLEVELTGEDREILVRDDGRVLLAIQHLLPRMMQATLGEMVPCRVDSEGFREDRVASLERLARKTAAEVARRNRPRTLRPMNPADRRTVHLALKDDEDVVTESSGEGFYKRVTIRPV